MRDFGGSASSQSRFSDIRLANSCRKTGRAEVPISIRQYALPAAGIAHLEETPSLFAALRKEPMFASPWPLGQASGATSIKKQRGKWMKSHMKTLLVGAALLAMGGVALAHHSFAMFDQEHPIELNGVVKDWKYTAPHAFIILEVKEADGTSQVWSLEGGAPSGLIRDGWTSKTLKPGDELKMTIDPLRSGAPGGAWNVNKVKFKNGDPIVVSH
jgi:Family of unknown function (DUF6152)